MLATDSLHPLARGEHGFTLIEMLVAMLCAGVIIIALVAILIFSTHQETRLVNVAQANQFGRNGMTRIIDELHSACIAPEFTPIQAESEENNLWFINAYSAEAVISEKTPEAYKHHIAFEGSEAEGTGKLVDYTYTGSGTWPKFTFTGTPTRTVIATNIGHSKAGGKEVPIFQYYAYALTSSSGTEAGLSMLNTTPLKAKGEQLGTTAATAASVLINFKTTVAGKKESTRGGHSIELSNQVTLSFSVPRSESTTVDGPCQ